MEKTVNIAIVDDHSLFRNGLRSLLDGKNGCRIVGDFADGKTFLEALPSLDAEVVLMDIAMPVISGDKATAQALALKPDLRVICLSMFGNENYYQRMVEAGACGFLLKDSEISEVFAAIEATAEGDNYFSDRLLTAISGAINRGHSSESDILSSRETDILLGICQGLSNQEIAERLFISKRTVDTHRANILEKTGCKNTAALVVFAIRNRIVEI